MASVKQPDGGIATEIRHLEDSHNYFVSARSFIPSLVERLHPAGIVRDTFSTSTNSATNPGTTCPADSTDPICAKPVSQNTFTLPIALGVTIPIVGALIAFFFLHRRHKRKLKEEDADVRNASLDFGLGNSPPVRNSRRPINMDDEFDMPEKPHARGRGLSMDMSNPYLLPPELVNSTESLRSLSRNIHISEDPYGPVSDLIAESHSPRYNHRDGGSSIYTGSSGAPSRFHDSSTADLLSNARLMSRSPAPRQNPLQPKSSLAPIDTRQHHLPTTPSPISLSPVEPAYTRDQTRNVKRKSGQNQSQGLSFPLLNDTARESYVSDQDKALPLNNSNPGHYVHGREYGSSNKSQTPPLTQSPESAESQVPTTREPSPPPPPAAPEPVAQVTLARKPPFLNSLPANPRPPRKESVQVTNTQNIERQVDAVHQQMDFELQPVDHDHIKRDYEHQQLPYDRQQLPYDRHQVGYDHQHVDYDHQHVDYDHQHVIRDDQQLPYDHQHVANDHQHVDHNHQHVDHDHQHVDHDHQHVDHDHQQASYNHQQHDYEQRHIDHTHHQGDYQHEHIIYEHHQIDHEHQQMESQHLQRQNGPDQVEPGQRQPHTEQDQWYGEAIDYRDDFHGNPPAPPPKNDALHNVNHDPGNDRQNRRYSMDVPPEEFANAGLGAPGFDARRISLTFRPLPPSAAVESDDPEIRANRIRSFYKEYFDDSKPAPRGEYYEDYDSGYNGTAYQDPYYNDHNYNYQPMPYAQPMARRAMTPPPRAGRYTGQVPRAFHGSMTHMNGRPVVSNDYDRSYSLQSSLMPPQPERPYSTMSGFGRPAIPPRGRLRPPPQPLNSLPTPSKLKDDSFAIMNAIDFAPPASYRERAKGRSQSPLGERRPYSPTVPAFKPLASAFEELPQMPSPHHLPKSGTFTGLDFAPPRKIFRVEETMSDSGSIRSNASAASARQVRAIRSGAYRTSRLPGDQVFAAADITTVLKPTWDQRAATPSFA